MMISNWKKQTFGLHFYIQDINWKKGNLQNLQQVTELNHSDNICTITY